MRMSGISLMELVFILQLGKSFRNFQETSNLEKVFSKFFYQPNMEKLAHTKHTLKP